jgi:hypothetical protein
MVRPTRLPLAVLAAAVLAFAVGCGGADPAAYVKQVNVSQATFGKQFAKVQADLRPENSAVRNKEVLARFSLSIQRAVDRLRKVAVPDGVTELHQQLITDLETFGQEIAKAEQQFGSNDPKQIVAAQSDIDSAAGTNAERINATLEKINAQLHK